MAEAVALAESGVGSTCPNPSVGAVVVRGASIVGRGRTGPAGTAHAEVRALRAAGPRARGATMYVTLEPCAHHGRTPPCVEAILAAGIRRVVVGLRDPAPNVAGRGIRWLRRHGVEVTCGVGRAGCLRAHEFYLHHVRTGRPFVTVKLATSLDGRIATETGESKWITGAAARRHAHRERARHHAVCVGVGTVLADDPALTVRHVRGVDPIPVVLDGRLRTADRPHLAVLRPGTLVFHGPKAARARRRTLRGLGAVPLEVPRGAFGLDLDAVLDVLGSLEVRSLLVEGGGEVAGGFVRTGRVDRLLLYRAPVLLGEGRAAVAGWAASTVDGAPRFVRTKAVELGDDLLEVLRPAGRKRPPGRGAGDARGGRPR
ncbi:MAG: bifunctional diaminohydroxyphosphoribosylaminopyrimidine deaminase/5-amino-6-(5-phosphoribosylamino)uracil reductase RibD [Deltaproteobacteria bacterium]|nr:MAG: bifunctional diaminohydroxyphosphoribosylaminopyrimidine deaminase/5-amino-6-(5-phosphoribosylamino)uracil reductase RibD [Deltaproteobacteria bacterium]